MKKKIYFLVSIALTILILSSCEEDERPEPTIIGAWTRTNTINTGYTFVHTLEFEEDGGWSHFTEGGSSTSSDYTIYGTYTMSGDTMTRIEYPHWANGDKQSTDVLILDVSRNVLVITETHYFSEKYWYRVD
jgi:hypothetical protein